MVNELLLGLQFQLYQVQQQPCLFLYQNARFILPALKTVQPQPNWQVAKNYMKISKLQLRAVPRKDFMSPHKLLSKPKIRIRKKGGPRSHQIHDTHTHVTWKENLIQENQSSRPPLNLISASTQGQDKERLNPLLVKWWQAPGRANSMSFYSRYLNSEDLQAALGSMGAKS